MNDLSVLNDRERFIISIIILNEKGLDHYKLINIILKSKSGPFYGLNQKYVKYTLVKKIANKLISRNILYKDRNEYSIKDSFKLRFIKEYPEDVSNALTLFSSYRHKYHLEFDLVNVENDILNSDYLYMLPYDAIEQIKQAIEIYKNTSSYDSVITKCGKVMEILVNKLNKDYKLISRNEPITVIIRKLKEEDTIKKVESEKRESFRVFSYSAYIIYKFRSKMGAHADWWWGMEEIAMSCLMLTLYLLDLFSMDLHISSSKL